MAIVKLNPYISFGTQAKEAMEFYKGVFGGTLTMNTFGEYKAAIDPSENDNIMHAALEVSESMTLMGADTPKAMGERVKGNNISISLGGDDEAQLKGYWDKLSEGATITMPLEKAMWGDTFGMLTDKFGINWMVNIAGPKPAEA